MTVTVMSVVSVRVLVVNVVMLSSSIANVGDNQNMSKGCRSIVHRSVDHADGIHASIDGKHKDSDGAVAYMFDVSKSVSDLASVKAIGANGGNAVNSFGRVDLGKDLTVRTGGPCQYDGLDQLAGVPGPGRNELGLQYTGINSFDKVHAGIACEPVDQTVKDVIVSVVAKVQLYLVIAIRQVGVLRITLTDDLGAHTTSDIGLDIIRIGMSNGSNVIHNAGLVQLTTALLKLLDVDSVIASGHNQLTDCDRSGIIGKSGETITKNADDQEASFLGNQNLLKKCDELAVVGKDVVDNVLDAGDATLHAAYHCALDSSVHCNVKDNGCLRTHIHCANDQIIKGSRTNLMLIVITIDMIGKIAITLSICAIISLNTLNGVNDLLVIGQIIEIVEVRHHSEQQDGDVSYTATGSGKRSANYHGDSVVNDKIKISHGYQAETKHLVQAIEKVSDNGNKANNCNYSAHSNQFEDAISVCIIIILDAAAKQRIHDADSYKCVVILHKGSVGVEPDAIAKDNGNILDLKVNGLVSKSAKIVDGAHCEVKLGENGLNYAAIGLDGSSCSCGSDSGAHMSKEIKVLIDHQLSKSLEDTITVVKPIDDKLNHTILDVQIEVIEITIQNNSTTLSACLTSIPCVDMLKSFVGSITIKVAGSQIVKRSGQDVLKKHHVDDKINRAFVDSISSNQLTNATSVKIGGITSPGLVTVVGSASSVTGVVAGLCCCEI